MIILEGPDGAGKTTLLRYLQTQFGIETNERASTSEGGPVADLDAWCASDLKSWESSKYARFYDRHPFISEFIYGPVIRGRIKDNIDAPDMLTFREQFDREALLVLCLPPFAEVVRNIRGSHAQMPGVDEHITSIYTLYQNLLFVKQPARNIVWYDYTVHTTAFVESQVFNHINNWELQHKEGAHV